jgi:NAD-dependent SIR2 family protein deacetylase
LYFCKIKIQTMSKKNIVVLTGAGISAESGIKTFRDSGGLSDITSEFVRFY